MNFEIHDRRNFTATRVGLRIDSRGRLVLSVVNSMGFPVDNGDLLAIDTDGEVEFRGDVDPALGFPLGHDGELKAK